MAQTVRGSHSLNHVVPHDYSHSAQELYSHSWRKEVTWSHMISHSWRKGNHATPLNLVPPRSAFMLGLIGYFRVFLLSLRRQAEDYGEMISTFEEAVLFDRELDEHEKKQMRQKALLQSAEQEEGGGDVMGFLHPLKLFKGGVKSIQTTMAMGTEPLRMARNAIPLSFAHKKRDAITMGELTGSQKLAKKKKGFVRRMLSGVEKNVTPFDDGGEDGEDGGKHWKRLGTMDLGLTKAELQVGGSQEIQTTKRSEKYQNE